MQTPLTSPVPVPVPVLRLPRGPDGLSRGFAPDGRRALLKPEVPETLESSLVHECQESQEQQARANLRERYLRSLLAMYTVDAPAFNESAAANKQAGAELGGGALGLPAATTTTTREAHGGGS
uniref:Gem nuclear organelle associated protein 7 n=1 Tax=Molossus molossus TaxID=27622 RepID=A0A7J8C7E3_MOLMO|nr:gem nuclear organelle associated protein 7 [Molossus molossus]